MNDLAKRGDIKECVDRSVQDSFESHSVHIFPKVPLSLSEVYLAYFGDEKVENIDESNALHVLPKLTLLLLR